MHKDELKKYLPLMIAAGLGLAVAVYYFTSGNSNVNNYVRELEKKPTVDRVDATDNNTIVVKCKNGESYEIVYKPGQTGTYQDIVYDKCGEGGLESVSTQQQ